MMNRKFRKFLNPPWLIAASLFASANASQTNRSKPEPLMIQEQGSFAVGGSVVTNAGTFNPKQPTPDGQTLHGDHAYVYYQIPANNRKLPLCFCTAQASSPKRGRPHLTEERAFRQSSFVVAFRYI